MLKDLVNYLSKIPIQTHVIGTVLFFSIIGFIPLFGYSISVSQSKINSSSDFNPPKFSPFTDIVLKGIIGIIFILIVTIPSGIVYAILPVLLNVFDVSNSFQMILLLLVSIGGLLLSILGLYLFTVLIYSYCKFTSNNESFKVILENTLKRKMFSRGYALIVFYISVISIVFGILVNILLLSVIFSPFVGPVAVFYFSTMGYLIGSVENTKDYHIRELKSDLERIT